MHRIAVVSPLGGSGRTTLVAHIAHLLTQRGQLCLAVDLCPQNHLGIHLGQMQPNREGWGASVIQNQWWASDALENAHGVGFLPFGLIHPNDFDVFHRLMTRNSQWLADQLLGLEIDERSLILLDTPTWPAPLAQQALVCADLLVVVVDVSVRACQAFDLVVAMLSQVPSTVPRGILITGFDARRASHRTILQTLRSQWGALLLPYVLHDDESIPAAQAQGLCVNLHSPHAQSAHDLEGITGWIAQHCSPTAGAVAA